MAISAGVALLSTGVGVAVGTIAVSSAMAYFVGSFVLGAAMKALAPKPPSLGSNAANRGYQVTQRGAAVDHQIVYGETRVGGVVVFDATTGTDNKFLHRVVAFTGHEIEGFTSFILDDEELTIDGSGNVTSPSRYDGFVRINTHLGADDQVADSDLVSEVDVWTADHRLRGVSYAYFRFKYDADVFPNGIPEISAVIKGKKVYDPRTNTTAWSDNPALCIRDYLISEYGVEENSANIDDTLFAIAANVCDHKNYPTLSGGERFTLNGAFVVSATPYDVLNDLLTSLGGTLWYAQGQWRLKPSYYTAPTASFDEDDIRSSITVATRNSRRDSFNTVKGVFRGPDTNYQPTDYTPVTDADFITADGGQESVLNLDLPYTDSFDIARHLALITLERNRQQITVNMSMGMRAFQVQVGDVIQLSNTRFGWTNKLFEVVSWTFGLQDEYDLQVQLTLRETSANVYDEISDGAVLELDNTNFSSPFDDVQTVTLGTPTTSTKLNSDGTVIPVIEFNWSVTNPSLVDYYEFQWRVSGTTDYNSRLVKEQYYTLAPAESNVSYDYRVRTVSQLGVKSAFASVSGGVSTSDDTTAPALPTSVTALGGFKYVTINWVNPNDSDLNYVEVYENSSNTSVGATSVGRASGSTFTRVNLPIDTTRYYFLKAVDYSGNESGFTSGVSATTTGVEDADFENGVRQLFIDQGLDVIEPVSSLPASGDFTNQQVFLTSDGKLYNWNGSSWVPVIADVAAGSITSTEIADGSISTPKLSANAVTADKIVANTITGGLLATSGIITSAAQINDAVITNAKIANAAITNAKIGTAEVSTLKLQGESVTISTFFAGSTTFVNRYAFKAQDHVVNMPTAGTIQVVCQFYQFGFADENDNCTPVLKINGTQVQGSTLRGANGTHVLIGSLDTGSGNVTLRGEFTGGNFTGNVQINFLVLRRFR